MGYIAFLLTVVAQGALIKVLKLLDNFFVTIGILVCCLGLGLVMRLTADNYSMKRHVGTGILYGSLTSLTLSIAFIIWLAYALAR